MEIAERTASFLDITPYVTGNATVPLDPISKLPMVQVPLPLNPGEVWRARILPMITTGQDDNRAWSTVREGAAIRIPLLPYRISRDPAEGMLGVIEVTQCLLAGCPGAKRTHFVIGTPVQDLSADGWDSNRIWLGFAARMQ